MHKSYFLFVFLFFFCMPFLRAQESYTIQHQSYSFVPEANFDTDVFTYEKSELYNDSYVRFVQFYTLPNSNQRQRLEAQGWQFLSFIHKNTYTVAIPANYDGNLPQGIPAIRSVIAIPHAIKAATAIYETPKPDHAVQKDERIALQLRYYAHWSRQDIQKQLRAQQTEAIVMSPHQNIAIIHVAEKDISKLAEQPFVEYLSLIPEPGKPDDTPARGLHRNNALHADFPMGRQYTGEGINLQVRDDAAIWPHVDFKGRLVNLPTNYGGTHGDQVGGVAGGAGNIDPTTRGMAVGVTLYATDYVADFLDTTLGLHIFHDVMITNSSYSNGCNDGYTQIASTVDEQMYYFPHYIHVFSAGNSGNFDCGYGAGNQWGNVTGGHKQGKNVIATANLYADAELVESSSRGPAADGRIKPDIAANGEEQVTAYPDNMYDPFGGTSGASPGIAGILAQLYQAYRELNGNAYPNAGLMKACLLNTANDLGNKGPDYKFGWGHVNALRAVQLIENANYMLDSIDHEGVNEHTLTIPDNVIEARVMVYWTDPPSLPGVTKALINDLNMEISTPDSSIHMPWVLRIEPDPLLLDMPAGTGRDSLNNMEQIVIEQPAAGDYTIAISGL